MKRYPRIIIDYAKCPTPFDCKKCLVTCPQAIFEVFPIKIEKFKETDKKEPGTYQLSTFFIDKCTACEDCIKVCPTGALSINY